MSFASVLDAYCNAIGCTNRELAERCSLSPSALSRYRNGERTPEIGSDVIDRLVVGIATLSDERGLDKSWREDIVRSALEASLSGSKTLGLDFGARLGTIMELLNLRNSEVAQALGVSPSYISRIRSGQRMPSSKQVFAGRFARLTAARCAELKKTEALMDVLAANGGAIGSHVDWGNAMDVAEVVEQWLLGNNLMESDLAVLNGFFEKLNQAYYEDEINKLRDLVPDSPPYKEPDEIARYYSGNDHIRRAEKDFFDIAVSSRAQEIFLSSDVPLLEITLASDFVGSYSLRVGGLVRNGAHITVLHSVERPFVESLMAMELWLPLYFTGNVTPYFIPGVSNRLFCHMNYVSDTCALTCDAVMGHQSEGRCHLSTLPDDVRYVRRKADFLMERASPMIELYSSQDEEQRGRIEQIDAFLAERGTAHEVAKGKYDQLRIFSLSGNDAAISFLQDPSIRLVLHHPKICYAISQMK